MSTTELIPRLRTIVVGLVAALATIGVVISVAATPADAQQDVEDGLQEVEDEVTDGGGEGDPTEELEGQDPTEELEGQDPTEERDGQDGLEQPDEGDEGADAQQLEEALTGLEEAVNDALGDSGGDGGQEECATALEDFFTDPAQDSFEGAVETCLAAIDEDVELDDETLQECETAFEGFLNDPSEETLQTAVDSCIQSLQNLVESGQDGGGSEPDAGTQPSEDDGGGQVDEVPGVVHTGGAGTPTDGAHAGAALTLFAGLTAAGTLASRRRAGATV